MARPRSPNYPRLSLPEAVEKLSRLWEVKERRTMKADEAAKALGYSALNGSAQGVISALKKYGLVSGRGNGLAITREAIAVVALSRGAPERIAALEAAALQHPVFANLHQSGTESDERLRHLLLDQGFGSKAASLAVQAYRSTLEFLEAEGVTPPPPTGQPSPFREVGVPTVAEPPATIFEAPAPPAATRSEPTSESATAPFDSPGDSSQRALRVELSLGKTRITLMVDGNGAPIASAVMAQVCLFMDLMAHTGESPVPSE